MSEPRIKIATVRGLAVKSFVSVVHDAAYDVTDSIIPKWLVGCLALITMDREGAIDSLLENLDNEPELEGWLYLQILDLINEIHNGEIDQPAPLVTPTKPEPTALVQNNIINIGRRPTEPETETKIVDAIVSGKAALQIADETSVHRNTVSNIKRRHDIRPEREEVEHEPKADEDGSYLGTIRRAIGEATEPFTKDQIRESSLRDNPGWEPKHLNKTLHNTFALLERTNKIRRDPSDDPTQPGETHWLRTDEFNPEKETRRGSSQPIVEPSTGHEWKSVQEFLAQHADLESHRVYRAIKSGKPLDDGRIIQYANGKGQRKPGEPFESKEKSIEVKSKLVEQKRPTQFEAEPSQWICDACGHTIDVNPVGRSPAVRCAKCRGACWSGVKKPLAV